MSMKIKLFALLTAFSLFAVACGGAEEDVVEDVTPATTQTTQAPAEEPETEEAGLPGEGVSVKMARADWSTGYFQAALYANLLRELGYEVSDPADLELGPSLAYLAMAEGDFDFWVNSWYPGHNSWMVPQLPDGSAVGDHISMVGEQMMSGGLQGYLITKTWADEYGVYSMDDLNNNADALASFDASDPSPGNGVADIYGCSESWTCDNIITAQIAFAGWENIDQVIAGYDAMIAEATAKANDGVPMVIYTWTPSAYITELRPGDNVYWLTVNEVIDDSNPSGVEGGEAYDQRPGTANIGTDLCPGATDSCQLGWVAADIQVTANNDFLAANPAAAKLLELVQLPIFDVSVANVAQSNGADSTDAINGLAADWIDTNEALVDSWLAEAMSAAG
jgi:glycine betaine/proline transport system substrate-binding protein